MTGKFYNLTYASENKLELYIYGNICEWPDGSSKGVVADLQYALNQNIKDIDVHINSLGGEVKEGIAIYNLLKNSNVHVTTYVDGFACSAASIIFAAGDDRVMPENSILMIHCPWEYAEGNAKELEEEVKILNKLSESLEKIYLANSTLKEEELKDLLDGETGNGTWLSAEEAKNYGLATEILKENNKSYSNSVTKIILNTMRKNKKEDVEKNKNIDMLTLDAKLSKILDKLDKITTTESADLTPKKSQDWNDKKNDAIHQKTKDDDSGHVQSNFEKMKNKILKAVN